MCAHHTVCFTPCFFFQGCETTIRVVSMDRDYHVECDHCEVSPGLPEGWWLGQPPSYTHLVLPRCSTGLPLFNISLAALGLSCSNV